MKEKAQYIYVCISCGNEFDKKPKKCDCWDETEFVIKGIPSNIWHKLLDDVNELKSDVQALRSSHSRRR